MWAGLIALATKLLSIFFPDKSAESIARDDGVISGQSQQKAADQAQTIEDVRNAKIASDSVDRSTAIGVPITESDGFRRD